MRVVVPPQSVDRNDDNWLYHRTSLPESMTNQTDLKGCDVGFPPRPGPLARMCFVRCF